MSNNYFPVVVSNLRKAQENGLRCPGFCAGGGGRFLDLRNVLQVCCSVSPLVPIIDLGDDPQDQSYPYIVTSEFLLPFGRDATEMRFGEVVGVPTFGSGDGGGGPRGGGGVLPPLLEHYRLLHCDSSDTGDVSGGVTASRIVVIM